MARVASYLGVDLGGGGIKIVELGKQEGRARLLTYAWVERGPLESNVDWVDDQERTASMVRNMKAEARVRTNVAVAALPLYSVFTSILNFSNVDRKELPAAVQWEAKKILPFPIDDAVLDWQVIPNGYGAPEHNRQEVLVTAAPRTLRDKYVELFRKAGLELAGLETEAFGFIRSLIGTDRTPAIIVDIGSRKSNVLIVDRGVPAIAHSVEVGGQHITDAIAHVMHIAPDNAENVKYDMAAVMQTEGLPQLIKDTLNPLKNAIQYAMSLYRTKLAGTITPERLILTGGSAVILGLPEYLTSIFNVRTFVGDPWARVPYPEGLKPSLQDIGPRFAVAVGLAMRQII